MSTRSLGRLPSFTLCVSPASIPSCIALSPCHRPPSGSPLGRSCALVGPPLSLCRAILSPHSPCVSRSPAVSSSACPCPLARMLSSLARRASLVGRVPRSFVFSRLAHLLSPARVPLPRPSVLSRPARLLSPTRVPPPARRGLLSHRFVLTDCCARCMSTPHRAGELRCSWGATPAGAGVRWAGERQARPYVTGRAQRLGAVAVWAGSPCSRLACMLLAVPSGQPSCAVLGRRAGSPYGRLTPLCSPVCCWSCPVVGAVCTVRGWAGSSYGCLAHSPSSLT